MKVSSCLVCSVQGDQGWGLIPARYCTVLYWDWGLIPARYCTVLYWSWGFVPARYCKYCTGAGDWYLSGIVSTVPELGIDACQLLYYTVPGAGTAVRG